ncbi:MAG: Asp-tRNA(Asn)/Glu-tRNA(Gln) amidotransferase subunit GatC [Gammaproteobacteria bacterium]|nr:Asp-tRNA(Asn)/Glu-tRNA(Gln) amidotransferase subunit GatC [Gammaproteobacteria bacterium]
MNTLTEAEIKKYARLARLEVTSAEISAHQENLAKILALVEQIMEVPTDGILPLAHPLAGFQHLRDDDVSEIVAPELQELNAPLMADGLYLVPKVIDPSKAED